MFGGRSACIVYEKLSFYNSSQFRKWRHGEEGSSFNTFSWASTSVPRLQGCQRALSRTHGHRYYVIYYYLLFINIRSMQLSCNIAVAPSCMVLQCKKKYQKWSFSESIALTLPLWDHVCWGPYRNVWGKKCHRYPLSFQIQTNAYMNEAQWFRILFHAPLLPEICFSTKHFFSWDKPGALRYLPPSEHTRCPVYKLAF